jgi:hypothetical protein
MHILVRPGICISLAAEQTKTQVDGKMKNFNDQQE